MCCNLTVQPLDKDLAAAILAIGQFELVLTQQDGGSQIWRRIIPEEGTSVTATLGGAELSLSINPTIGAYAHHAGKRITAGVYFEIAARYAEKVNGVVLQHSTVTGCTAGSRTLLVAQYPETPLSFERVCPGFQAVILGADA